MMIRRCAWHRSYRGYPLAFGIASWRGLRISFTDGMCLRCSTRMRAEWNLPPLPPRAGRYRLGFELARVTAMAAAVAGLVLAANPLDDIRTLRAIVPAPQTVLVPPPAIAEEAMPSLSVSHVSRRPVAPMPKASYLGVVVANTAMPPVSERRWPSRTLFAALPHAGLAQQTP